MDFAELFDHEKIVYTQLSWVYKECKGIFQMESEILISLVFFKKNTNVHQAILKLDVETFLNTSEYWG